jgi:uncharacterized protein YecT (DUF1311 family)
MQRLLSAACGLCALVLTQTTQAREARDYEADERRMLDCVEAAERTRSATGIDLTRQCIGQQTQFCDRVTQDTYQSNKRMFCAGAEAKVWRSFLERAYSLLMEDFTKADEDARRMSAVSFESSVDALKRAHEAWSTANNDCELARVQARDGTDRYDVPARCERDRLAERALLYRRWLGGQMY